jgi:hypothetical protein
MKIYVPSRCISRLGDQNIKRHSQNLLPHTEEDFISQETKAHDVVESRHWLLLAVLPSINSNTGSIMRRAGGLWNLVIHDGKFF